MALCIEAGGRLNEQFLKLIDYFASVNGSTEAERRAFTIFAPGNDLKPPFDCVGN